MCFFKLGLRIRSLAVVQNLLTNALKTRPFVLCQGVGIKWRKLGHCCPRVFPHHQLCSSAGHTVKRTAVPESICGCASLYSLPVTRWLQQMPGCSVLRPSSSGCRASHMVEPARAAPSTNDAVLRTSHNCPRAYACFNQWIADKHQVRLL